jgi:hypothetical protein
MNHQCNGRSSLYTEELLTLKIKFMFSSPNYLDFAVIPSKGLLELWRELVGEPLGFQFRVWEIMDAISDPKSFHPDV